MKKQSHIKNSSKINIDVSQKPLFEITQLILEKAMHIRDIIHNTILSINQYKKYEIFSNSDLILCTSALVEIYEKTGKLQKKCEYEPKNGIPEMKATEINVMIDELQGIIDKLSLIMSGFGTLKLEDLFYVSFGADAMNTISFDDEIWREKYALLLKYFHPISYKTIYWRQNKTKPSVVLPLDGGVGGHYCTNKMIDEILQIELSPQFECYDVDTSCKSLFVKIYGISVIVHNEKTQKTIIIQGILDDVVLDCIKNKYIDRRIKSINASIIEDGITDMDIVGRIIETMGLKDILIYGNLDIYKLYVSVLAEVNGVKHSKLDMTIKKFLEMPMYQQRQMLLNLLIYNKEDEIQYITYLLYDLITSVSADGTTDTEEQKLIYESFPWKMKLFFKEAMKNTMKYTKEIIHKYDMNRVSLEQQIYVMKAPDNVKEKAIMKLKDVKSKGETESKAKQYLEALLRIPFGIYREEPILKKIKNINQMFVGVFGRSLNIVDASCVSLEKKGKYTSVEILKYIREIQNYIENHLVDKIKEKLDGLNVKELNAVVNAVNVFQKNLGRTPITPKTKADKIKQIVGVLEHEYLFIQSHALDCGEKMLEYDIEEYVELSKLFLMQIYDLITIETPEINGLVRITGDLDKCSTHMKEIKADMENIASILDESIYGHEHAKNQIMKIVGQWMNGELNGYVFGFEGSPGIGKTSLAKNGLAKCLSDGTTPRPFSFIALGGASNSSFLDGHGFTYLNSTHGKIVDILMEAKCMNPIIYIDELDKVSKTEHGKEIIGVLTHLTDPTQNDVFQDKYFSGIDLDLSKALIIFSYNDVSQIDRVLLDRIHRIKFDNLTVNEKIVIVRKFLLPSINRKMGFENVVEISDSVIEFIIQEYTVEPGVRKLKEILFDLYGEINLELLKGACDEISIPVVLTNESVETKYLHKYDKINERKIHVKDEVGVVNCLWANSLGMGGIMTMKSAFAPSNTFLELKLTGMQSGLMKESMQLAVNVAWELLSTEKQGELVEKFAKTKCQAIHIHMGSFTTKDGPSASALTSICVYSLFMGIPIKHDVAFTGEIDYLGRVNEIGGLEHKIFGALRAGVKKVLYPRRNHDDFVKIMKKDDNSYKLENMEFIEIDHITDAMPHLLVA